VSADDTPGGSRQGPDRPAFLIAAGLIVVAGVIAWDASYLRGATGYAKIGPAAFPFAVAAGLTILAGATAFAAWRGRFPPREADRAEPVLWIIGGLAAQMLLLKTAGFSIATGLLFGATARAFGRGPLWLTVPIGVVVSFIVWMVFALALKLSLPAGPLERLIF
jgi:putative tricarboxylic transport membrane protein